jgi:hypothetical protein
MDDEQAYKEIEAQIGRGAGNIAATNFRFQNWLSEIVTDAARAMQVSLRSAWTLVEIWNNGTTIWESPEGDKTATVPPEGDEIQVH